MYLILRAAIAILSATAFILFSILGYDWLTIGHGLNPWLAFPTALAMLAVFTWNAHALQLDYEEFTSQHYAPFARALPQLVRALHQLEQQTINKL
jgi:hypothetical protein